MFSIDRKRVYATGISNGAIFAQRLGCELPGKIAAIAPGGWYAGQGSGGQVLAGSADLGVDDPRYRRTSSCRMAAVRFAATFMGRSCR